MHEGKSCVGVSIDENRQLSLAFLDAMAMADRGRSTAAVAIENQLKVLQYFDADFQRFLKIRFPHVQNVKEFTKKECDMLSLACSKDIKERFDTKEGFIQLCRELPKFLHRDQG